MVFRTMVACAVALALPTAAARADIAGYVNRDGSLIQKVTAFKVTHTATGAYTMSFKKPLARTAVCEYLPYGNAATIAVTSISSNTMLCGVQFIDAATGKPADAAFVFRAVAISP
jgi:hypothetical protein